MKIIKEDNLVVILARGGSKRIPNKNIRKIQGKPLICYSIDIARKSNIFHNIHISTDSVKIKHIVEKYGVKIDFMRPKYLSGDKVPTMPVVKYVVNKYKKKLGINYKNIFILSATNPFLDKKDIINSFNLYLESKKPILSVCKYPAPIQWAFRANNTFNLSPINKNSFLVRSQDLENHYFDVGAFSIHNIKDLNKTRNGYDDKFKGFELSREKSIDIDYLEDLKYVKKIYKQS